MRKMINNFLLRLVVVLVAVVLGFSGNGLAGESAPPKNLLENPGFEYGVAGWRLDKAGETQATFKVDRVEAAHGKSSRLGHHREGRAVGYTIRAERRGPGARKNVYLFRHGQEHRRTRRGEAGDRGAGAPGIERPQPSRSR